MYLQSRHIVPSVIIIHLDNLSINHSVSRQGRKDVKIDNIFSSIEILQMI